MALVAYDYSDASDTEDDGNANVVTLNLKKQALSLPEPIKQIKNVKAEFFESEVATSSGQNLFNLLPQPSKLKPSFAEDDDEFLHKKETNSVIKPKAKITVPSLSDFKDVEGSIPVAKPKIVIEKKSGLLSMLPQPRNSAVSAATTTKSFVPHVLTKKTTATVNKKSLPSPMKRVKTQTAPKDFSDDSDNDDEVHNDFFSINKPDEPLIEDIPLDIDLKPKEVKKEASTKVKEPFSLQSYFKQDVEENKDLSTDLQESVSYAEQGNPDGFIGFSGPNASNSTEAVLDEEAIMKLCGTRGKRKREEIQIVDVNQKEVLADAREWLLKGLMDDTTKRTSSSKKRGNEPTSQQRRKHQITYLAHQAKANEAELQNQWANNRQTKRQTQSKYGF